MLYECHITCKQEDAAKATEVAAAGNWKTSEIARDPTLGQNTYFYLTSHDRDIERMFSRMRQCSHVLKMCGVDVLREKIELIIYDTKQSVPKSIQPETPR